MEWSESWRLCRINSTSHSNITCAVILLPSLIILFCFSMPYLPTCLNKTKQKKKVKKGYVFFAELSRAKTVWAWSTWMLKSQNNKTSRCCDSNICMDVLQRGHFSLSYLLVLHWLSGHQGHMESAVQSQHHQQWVSAAGQMFLTPGTGFPAKLVWRHGATCSTAPWLCSSLGPPRSWRSPSSWGAHTADGSRRRVWERQPCPYSLWLDRSGYSSWRSDLQHTNPAWTIQKWKASCTRGTSV